MQSLASPSASGLHKSEPVPDRETSLPQTSVEQDDCPDDSYYSYYSYDSYKYSYNSYLRRRDTFLTPRTTE